MLFNSIDFLCFFPIVALFYWVLPHKVRWVWLLVASYYFYMCWNASYALLILTSTVITYLSGILIGRCDAISDATRAINCKKAVVFCSLTSNLAILFFFKYFNFFIENVNFILTQLNLPMVTSSFSLLLPVGISFYTFQALSYTLDVYRGALPPEQNFGKYALFVSFFPQLVAGPIERSTNLMSQMHTRHVLRYDDVKNGLLLMLWGFFQKLVIADRAAFLVNQVFDNYTQYAGLEIFFAVAVFSVQIYCDFGGYSNIAIGAAQVMGFSLMKNFDRPYFSQSIGEFWRRWHVSLSSWFRDYLYIPLGGGRKGRLRKYFNLTITFLASGLWHGANWTYALWGVLNGIFQIIGELLTPLRTKIAGWLHLEKIPRIHALCRIVITYLLFDFTLMIFRADSISHWLALLNQLCATFNPEIFTNGALLAMGLDVQDLTVLAIATAVLFLAEVAQSWGDIRPRIATLPLPIRWGIYYIAIFAILIFGIYGPEFDASAFIYFQF